MAEHYFSQHPQSESSPKTWNYQLRGVSYTFKSDVGVFSKKEIDFGTKLLIEQFSYPDIQGDILDLGCGYGPIGITLAQGSSETNIVMADINERAVALAVQNSETNGVKNVEVIQSDRFSNLEGRSFAAILTNPPIRAGKEIVHHMFEESAIALVEGGDLWVVIQKKQGAPSAIEKLNSLFGKVEVIIKKKGYFIIKATKV